MSLVSVIPAKAGIHNRYTNFRRL